MILKLGLRNTPSEPGSPRFRENGIEHRFTKINHPWTNGQVERMNRTIKDAPVKRFHYDRGSAASPSSSRIRSGGR
jgi:transposase InsO family protein